QADVERERILGDLAAHARAALVAVNVSRVASSTADFFVSVSKRCTITSQYSGSSSMRNALRCVCSAAAIVLPEPPKRSSTFSPGRLEYWMARAASSTGFSVKWIIDCGLTFLTSHKSVAL